MSKIDEYVRKTYRTGWFRSEKPLTDAEVEKIQSHYRRLQERSMEHVK